MNTSFDESFLRWCCGFPVCVPVWCLYGACVPVAASLLQHSLLFPLSTAAAATSKHNKERAFWAGVESETLQPCPQVPWCAIPDWVPSSVVGNGGVAVGYNGGCGAPSFGVGPGMVRCAPGSWQFQAGRQAKAGLRWCSRTSVVRALAHGRPGSPLHLVASWHWHWHRLLSGRFRRRATAEARLLR